MAPPATDPTIGVLTSIKDRSTKNWRRYCTRAERARIISAVAGLARNWTWRGYGEVSCSVPWTGTSCRHGDSSCGNSFTSIVSSPRPVRCGLPVTARTAFSGRHSSQAGTETRRTESVTATQKTIELLEVLGRDTLQTTLVAHHLDFMAVLHDIEEDQFASGESIGTDSSYYSKYMGIAKARKQNLPETMTVSSTESLSASLA
jgi:hypothetical protein